MIFFEYTCYLYLYIKIYVGFLYIKLVNYFFNVLHIKIKNKTYKLHTNNYIESKYLVQEIITQNVYLPNNYFNINDNDVILDIGANIGLFTKFIQKLYNVEVHSFEPVKPIYDLLIQNTDINTIHNNIAISNESGKTEIYYNKNISIWSSIDKDFNQINDNIIIKLLKIESFSEKFKKNIIDLCHYILYTKEKYICTKMTVSDYIKQNNINNISLLKIDVENHEKEIIDGIHNDDWEKISQVVIETENIESCEYIEDILNKYKFTYYHKYLDELINDNNNHKLSSSIIIYGKKIKL